MPKGKSIKRIKRVTGEKKSSGMEVQESSLTKKIFQNTQQYLEQEIKKYENIKVMYD